MSCGKRTYSVGSGNKINVNNNNNIGGGVSSKKKKKYSRASSFVPPTKFLLGGNIRDPLNLNGLPQEEDSSNDQNSADIALPALADFLLGGNINDPLNLKGTTVASRESSETSRRFRLYDDGDDDDDDDDDVDDDGDADADDDDDDNNDGSSGTILKAGDDVEAANCDSNALARGLRYRRFLYYEPNNARCPNYPLSPSPPPPSEPLPPSPLPSSQPPPPPPPPLVPLPSITVAESLPAATRPTLPSPATAPATADVGDVPASVLPTSCSPPPLLATLSRPQTPSSLPDDGDGDRRSDADNCFRASHEFRDDRAIERQSRVEDRAGDGITAGGVRVDATVPRDVAAAAALIRRRTCEEETAAAGSRLEDGKVANLCLNVVGSDARCKKTDRKDKIVSPVIPQPYRPLKTVPFRQIITPDLGAKGEKTPKFREKNARFQYGNYRRYYGYRNAVNGVNGVDPRIEIFQRRREFFENKDVLDVGCHVGHVSFVIARSFAAKSVTGVDIDRYLVEVAKKSVQYYVKCPSPYPTATTAIAADPTNKKVALKYKCYPVSMPILFGPIYRDNFESDSRNSFPKNVRFLHANYVLDSESSLAAETAQFDTVLCLSVTKWIHLNWGDDGLKLAFKRMYAQLKPGGILILEPQSWDSYKKKKCLTENVWRNYRNIQFFPHHFDRYLLSSEVGFSRCHTLAVVNHQHKGFRRAIKVFEKSSGSVLSPAVTTC